MKSRKKLIIFDIVLSIIIFILLYKLCAKPDIYYTNNNEDLVVKIDLVRPWTTIHYEDISIIYKDNVVIDKRFYDHYTTGVRLKEPNNLILENFGENSMEFDLSKYDKIKRYK